MNILGLKITSHDTGAALFSDNGVVAIAEERLSRVKHSRGMFPKLSIEYCLHTLRVRAGDVDYVVIDQVSHRSVVKMEKIFRDWDIEGRFQDAKVKVINHHDAHAATAFFCSPFEEAAVFVYDGSGEQFMTHFGVCADETESYYYGEKNSMTLLDKTLHLRSSNRRFPYTFGIGKLYSLLSAVYINFGKYSEGKMMGLAAYGDDRILKQFPMHQWWKEKCGDIVCNAQIIFPKTKHKANVLVRKLLHPKAVITGVNILKRKIFQKFQKFLKPLFVSTQGHLLHVDPKIFEPILFEKSPRPKDGPLPDKYYSSVAYAGQKILEAFAIACGKKLRRMTNTENICIAGGVGLNIDTNKHFIHEVGFKNIFVQPASSDTGIPLGCALYGWHVLARRPRKWIMESASLGRVYAVEEIKEALSKNADDIQYEESLDVCKDTAKLIADGKIIGWFHGGAEYGPRALGNRSIICDATLPEMKDILNDKVKHRESWRPFATSILAEHVSDWFDLDIPSPFMLFEGLVKADKRGRIPSVTHIDGTSRIQAVTPKSNKQYYNLIRAFYEMTGVPLILNTSFNLAGDPIVETPQDALETFLKTNMDYLILEDYIISKKEGV
jgi:carbamoyltransferase